MQLTYANPETGAHAQDILGFYELMLRAGQTLQLPLRSPAMVFHVIEGGITVQVDSDTFTLVQADRCCAPGFAQVTLRNSSAADAAFVFIADETPLHQKLGVFEVRS